MRAKKSITCLMIAFALVIVGTSYYENKVKGYCYIPSCREEGYRAAELYKQGYDPGVAEDQAAEEYGSDGPNGTGGFDGKLLNGQPAPNAGKTLDQIVGNVPSETPATGSTSKEVHKHTWVQTDNVEATCQKEGYIAYACSGCGKTKKETVEVASHNLELVNETGGDCSHYAVFGFKCTDCEYTEEIKGELGKHDFVLLEGSTEATCTEAGYEKKKCSICEKEEEGPTDPLGHSYATTITIMEEATCTKEGSKGYLCSVCGDVKDYTVIPAKGHTPGEPVREEAGLFNTGTIHTYCTTCHSLLEEEIIPAKVNPAVPAGIFVVIVIILAVVVIVKNKEVKM